MTTLIQKNVVPDDEDGDIEDSDEDESTPRLNIDDDDLEEKTEVKDFKKSLGTKKQVTSSKSSVPCPHCKEIFSNNFLYFFFHGFYSRRKMHMAWH